jgi:hypothetical protein
LGLQGGEEKGEWRRVLNKELNDLYFSPNTIRVITSRREVHTGFWWANLRNRDAWKTRCRGEDNIKIDLQEVGWGAWTGLIWIGTCSMDMCMWY